MTDYMNKIGGLQKAASLSSSRSLRRLEVSISKPRENIKKKPPFCRVASHI